MLESEISGGVARRSTTNFTHDDRVNGQNSHRHDGVEHGRVDVKCDNARLQTVPAGLFDSCGDQCDQSKTDDHFLRSA